MCVVVVVALHLVCEGHGFLSFRLLGGLLGVRDELGVSHPEEDRVQ